MIIHTNLLELQKQDSVLFSKNFNISMETGSMSFFEFTNKVMSRIYQLFFNAELPRVFQDMNTKLQLSSEPTRYCFLFKDYTIIRVYGFTKAPYVFPFFLKPRLFALEYVRKRLHLEKGHFISVKKACNIKFHFVIDPFVIKTSSALFVVDKLLKNMKFQEAQRIKYDPRQIISNRRLKNKSGLLEHQEVEGLRVLENMEKC